MHDFADKTLGKVVPYGIYDVAADEGWVSIGITADTAEFAVASIRTWLHRLDSGRELEASVLTCYDRGVATRNGDRPVKKYIIERDIPGVGGMSAQELCGAARTSNEALAQLSPKVQWQHSYVAGDKTFCVYLAEDEAAIQKHAELSGFPANKVTEVATVIDPTTGA